jgi:isoleucyl-tRNA synthetase
VKTLGNALDNKEMFEDIKNQLNDSKTANSNGYVAVEDNAYIVAINTEVSEELKNEGLIREIAHRIQGFRKDAGFEINDRIMLYVKLPKDMEIVLDSYADFIKEETLSNTIVINDVTDYDHTVEINGDELLFKVVKL